MRYDTTRDGRRAHPDDITLHTIARMQSDFPSKFGIPRQSGLVPSLVSTVVFEPAYRSDEALRGLEAFSHLWLLWGFSAARRARWSPTVRPPRLGGNKRVGVFATRSPFRPNPIGLSCVELLSVGRHPGLGPILTVAGADLMDGTPIYDIKPYLPYADCRPGASGGFVDTHARASLRVDLPEALAVQVPREKLPALLAVLAQDPRPPYQDAPERQYGMPFAGLEVKFTVRDGVVFVTRIEPAGGMES